MASGRRRSDFMWFVAVLLLAVASRSHGARPSSTSFFSRPWWQAIAAIAAIFGLAATAVVGFGVWRLDVDRETRLATANIDVQHTYHRDGPRRWRAQTVVMNDGPGAARVVCATIAPLNFVCFNVVLEFDPDTGAFIDSDAQISAEGAECGIGLISGRSYSQRELLPGIFARKADEEALSKGPALYSALIRDLLPGELLWMELSFELSDREDARLVTSEIDELETTFGTFTVLGDRIFVQRTPSRFIDHTDD